MPSDAEGTARKNSWLATTSFVAVNILCVGTCMGGPPPNEFYENWMQIVFAFYKIAMHTVNVWSLAVSVQENREAGVWRIFPLFLICGFLIEAPADAATPFVGAWHCIMIEIAAAILPSWAGWNPKEGSKEMILAVARPGAFVAVGFTAAVTVKILSHFS